MSAPVIIGAGHNGLAAAFYLAKAGLKPVVLEARDAVGGGAVTGEIAPGFRCPTLSHELLLHDEVARDMELARHGLEVITPAVHTLAPRADDPPLVIHHDAAQTAAGLGAQSARDADAYLRFRAAFDRMTAVMAGLLTTAPPRIDAPTAPDVWNLLKTGRRFRALGRQDGYRMLRWLPMPVADLAGEWFDDDLLRACVAAPGLSGTMLGPRSAGSTLVLMLRAAHAQLAGGRRVVRGGPGALSAAMAAAATQAGAQIRTGTPVERILTRDGRVTGVLAGGVEIPASLVMSAADPRTTFLRLVEAADLTPDFAAKLRNYRAAGTLAKVNLALARLPAFAGVAEPSLLSGRIHIGPGLDYLERAFDHAKYGEMSEAPWLDIAIPSVADPALAPDGAHVASVYVHYAPRALRIRPWSGHRDALLARTLDVIERVAPGFRASVTAVQVITPEDLESAYGYAGGHIFHGELAPDQLFTMRPLLGYAQYDSPIRGLYLCSGGTHPGGFLTGASGRLAARQVVRRLRDT